MGNDARERGPNVATPDASGHARALIESHGRTTALQIAQMNMGMAPTDEYWSSVYLNVFRLGYPAPETGDIGELVDPF